jgi:hypothetical protein
MVMQQIIERLLAGQEQMMADRKAEQEKAEADREHMQRIMAKIEAFREEMRVIMKVHREGMRAILGANRGKTEATDLKHNPEKTEVSLECEEPTSINMEPEAEHREVPKEEAAVMPVGGLRKRRRDRNLAAERGQKPKARSRRKLAAVRRGTTRRAKVAWRKGIIVRNKRTRSKVELATRRVGQLRKKL